MAILGVGSDLLAYLSPGGKNTLDYHEEGQTLLRDSALLSEWAVF